MFKFFFSKYENENVYMEFREIILSGTKLTLLLCLGLILCL